MGKETSKEVAEKASRILKGADDGIDLLIKDIVKLQAILVLLQDAKSVAASALAQREGDDEKKT